jgi:hypothetical protein
MPKRDDPRFMTMRNLVYMFYLTNPEITAKRMYIIWDSNRVLKEYPRPEFRLLQGLIEELQEEVI